MKEIKINFVSLGCDKNRADLEAIMANLAANGYKLASTNDEADAVIINSCGFIKAARAETKSVIREFYKIKRKNKNFKIIVSGCYSSISSLEKKYGRLIDLTVSKQEQGNIVSLLNGLFSLGIDGRNAYDRIITTRGYAFLKVAEGCNNFCSYCTIPHLTGRFKSRPLDELVLEAKGLAKKGITEIILVAQDVLNYGSDFAIEKRRAKNEEQNENIITLLKELEKIKEINWIRIMYAYPDRITDELIEYIKESKKVCPYLDVPLQHVSDRILTSMNRKTSKEQIENLIKKLKDNNITIRSTFIVGYPAETNQEFTELLEFLRKYKLNNVGFFKYSKEKDTKAYFLKQVPNFIKNLRYKKAYKVQQKIMKENQEDMAGKRYPAVYENGYLRLITDAPEIDNIVINKSTRFLDENSYYYVKIKKVNEKGLLEGEVYEIGNDNE